MYCWTGVNSRSLQVQMVASILDKEKFLRRHLEAIELSIEKKLNTRLSKKYILS